MYLPTLNESGIIVDLGQSVMGDVHQGRSVFGLGSAYMTYTFWHLVDYLHHYNYYLHYKTGKPRPVPPTWNIVKPFTWYSWIALGCCIPTTILLYALLSKLIDFNERRDWTADALMVFACHFLQCKLLLLYISIFY